MCIGSHIHASHPPPVQGFTHCSMRPTRVVYRLSRGVDVAGPRQRRVQGRTSGHVVSRPCEPHTSHLIISLIEKWSLARVFYTMAGNHIINSFPGDWRDSTGHESWQTCEIWILFVDLFSVNLICYFLENCLACRVQSLPLHEHVYL